MTEPWIERVIREAQEAGEFDGLAGTGEPIADLDQPYDPAWWARRWIVHEHQREAAAELAHSIQRDLPRVLAGTVAGDVRIGLESLNSQIAAHNESATAGNDVPLLDVDAFMSEWVRRHRRPGQRGSNNE